MNALNLILCDDTYIVHPHTIHLYLYNIQNKVILSFLYLEKN